MKSSLSLAGFFRHFVLVLLLALTFLPFLIMIVMAFKPTILITTDFLSFPKTLYLENFAKAWAFVKRPVFNSLLICVISLLGILINVTLSGYAFGRMEFRGKRFLFSLITAVIMVPTTITIVPQFIVVNRMKLTNTYWSLILPYIGSGQVIGIILARAHFEQMPSDLFDAARIDGANDLNVLLRVGLPLLKPTLITAGINSVVSMYNDYIWPTVTLTGGDEIKTFCQIVYNNARGYVRMDYGLLAAAFILGTLPLLFVTLRVLNYYIEGLVAGAVKE